MDVFSWLPFSIIGMTVGIFALTMLIVFWAMAAVRRSEARQRALLETGEPAEATVIDTNYTGVKVNGRRQIVTRLTVRRPGHQPYQAAVRYFMDGQLFSQTPLYPPGAVVQVRVDPARPQDVAIAGMNGAVDPGGQFAQPGQMNTQVYMVNGQNYSNLNDLPPHARQAIEQVGGLMADSNNNGMPDIFEQMGTVGRSEAVRSPSERLAELKRMRDEGLISEQEYEAKRQDILRQV
jgi:hypothetical protein